MASPIISLFQYICLPQLHTCLFSPVVKWESGGNMPQDWVPVQHSCWAFRGPVLFFFFRVTFVNVQETRQRKKNRELFDYSPPLWPLKRASFVWTSDRNKLDSGKCSDNWSALWLLIHWLWSHGRKNCLHQMRGQESSNVSAIMFKTTFRGWWWMKTIVLGKEENWTFMLYWNLIGRFLVVKMIVNRQCLDR